MCQFVCMYVCMYVLRFVRRGACVRVCVWSAFERFLKGFFGLARLEFAYQHGICVCVGECRFVPKIKLRERVCVGTFSVREPFKNWGVIP